MCKVKIGEFARVKVAYQFSTLAAGCHRFFNQFNPDWFVTLGPLRGYAMHRGGCLELYYCNVVEWSWWDSSLIWKTYWFPSVLWHCWFGHM